MTAVQPVEYTLVEFRPNPARPSEGRLLLGIVFAFAGEGGSGLGWRWRAGIPSGEIERLDPLARELYEHRKSTLKAEVEAAMQDSAGPSEVLAHLAGRNPWSFHLCKPRRAEVESFDPRETSLEDWVDTWTTQIFEEKALPTETPARRSGGRRRKHATDALPAAWLESPRLIRQVVREPLPA